MAKRGQTTAFVIVGIVILAVVILLFYLRGQFFFGPVTTTTLQDRLVPLETHIKDCLQDVSDEPLKRLGLQGGYLALNPGTFSSYQGQSISYLCFSQGGKATCSNRMLTTTVMEQQLSDAISQGLATCLNIGRFKRGFEMTVGQQEVVTAIGPSSIVVTLKMPLTISKEDIVIKRDSFSETFDYPLGRLYEVSQTIVDYESQYGEFEQLSYMLAHKGEYVIDKKKPYPDKVYILKTKDSPYIFQFMIQGEPTA
ncbi:hypothetical protein J4208_02895 [Candidatus Woesearchaeota archaeon]|nr:hypothetical protein [Candidatus Woesearchaeota archaeon]